MELGGKDACIVCEDADLALAAANIVKGGFSYSGQRCTAVKLVPPRPGARLCLGQKEYNARVSCGRSWGMCSGWAGRRHGAARRAAGTPRAEAEPAAGACGAAGMDCWVRKGAARRRCWSWRAWRTNWWPR